MNSKRDDFSENTKRILAERAGHRCSHPECESSTIGPNEDVRKSTSVGRACHIHAAAPGGPRFDPNMTREERKAITNGIWLCGTHADEIDKDKLRFRASTLFHWKTEAERRALQSRGRAPEGKQALETLTQALSGYPEKLIPDAIRNVARCSQSALEKVMPGTNVSVNLIDGVPTYTFTPKNWDAPPDHQCDSKR